MNKYSENNENAENDEIMRFVQQIEIACHIQDQRKENNVSRVERYFRLAQAVALKGDTFEARRKYRLGAVGVRSDGAIVTASNVPSRKPNVLACQI